MIRITRQPPDVKREPIMIMENQLLKGGLTAHLRLHHEQLGLNF
jgi:hypothetical protein